jgi:flavodoxin I
MSKTGIFYGSTTGNTEAAAQKIGEILVDANIQDIGSTSTEDLKEYDTLLLGTSTWGVGEIQDDWDAVLSELSGLDLSGKTIAIFGMGDQFSYEDSFADAMGILYEAVKDTGAKIVGAWPTVGYEYTASRAEQDGKFVGLVLDEDNQDEMTDDRIDKWVSGLKANIVG